MITSFAHVYFIVGDLDRSLRFYCDGLGLKHAFDFRDKNGKRTGVYIKAGGRNFIELFQGEVKADNAGRSFAHICMEVDDIEKTAAELKSKGIEVGPVSLGMDQSWQAWLADPDGNRIELHCYTPKSWQVPWLSL